MTLTTDQIMGVVAIFVPLLVAVAKKQRFSPALNAAIAIVIYVVVGLIAVVASGEALDINNIIPAVTIFTGVGTIAYQLWWKNWGDEQIQTTVLP